MKLFVYLRSQKASNKPVRVLYKFQNPLKQPKWKHFQNYEFDEVYLYNVVKTQKLPYELSRIIEWDKPSAEPHYCVYVIELNSDPNKVYVGYSWHTPEERLEQHNSGLLENGAAKVFRKGARGKLRPDLYKTYSKFHTKDEAMNAERFLAEKLDLLGYSVTSDGLKKSKRRNSKKKKLAKRKNQKLSLREVVESRGINDDNPSFIHGDVAKYGRHKKIEYERTLQFLDKLEKVGIEPLETISTIQNTAGSSKTDIYTEIRNNEAKRQKNKPVDIRPVNTRDNKPDRSSKKRLSYTIKERISYTTGDPYKNIELRDYLLAQKKNHESIKFRYKLGNIKGLSVSKEFDDFKFDENNIYRKIGSKTLTYKLSNIISFGDKE